MVVLGQSSTAIKHADVKIMEDVPHEKVVNVVPSGKIISQKMTAYLEEVGTRKELAKIY